MGLHKIIDQYQQWEERLRSSKKGHYIALRAFKWLASLFVSTVATLLITGWWNNLRWGRIITTLTWACGIGIVASFLVLDLFKANKKGFQMFWRPWVLLLLLAGVFQLRQYLLSHQIPDPISFWEEKYPTSPLTGKYKNSGDAATYAFWEGDYAYSYFIFNDLAKKNPKYKVGSNNPLLYASQLAENPTSEGYRLFNVQLDDLYTQVASEINEDRKTGKNLEYNNFGVVDDLIIKLRDVEKVLPGDQSGNIHAIRTNVWNLEQTKLNADSNWPNEP